METDFCEIIPCHLLPLIYERTKLLGDHLECFRGDIYVLPGILEPSIKPNKREGEVGDVERVVAVVYRDLLV